jgi:hypothetical protein
LTRLSSRFVSKRSAFVFALVAVAALAAASPARAAGADDKGWFVFLDLANSQPVSLDQHFANHVDTTGATSVNERLVIDNDADLTFKIGGGYGFGNGNGSLRVSYWSFDNDDEESGSVNGYLLPTLMGYGYNGGGMYLYNATGVTFNASSSVKASTIDVDYLREIVSGKKASLLWLAGLRVASWEEDQAFDGHDGISDYFQEKHFESDGIGLRVGAAAEFQFTEHFGMKSSLVFSFLQADTEGESSQTFAIGATPTDRNEGSDDNIKGEMRDFDVKAVWTYGRMSYWVGYETYNWDGLVTDPIPQGDSDFFGIGPTDPRGRDSIAFNSLHAGVGFKFGGGKK